MSGITRSGKPCQQCARLGRPCGTCLGPAQTGSATAGLDTAIDAAVDAASGAGPPTIGVENPPSPGSFETYTDYDDSIEATFSNIPLDGGEDWRTNHYPHPRLHVTSLFKKADGGWTSKVHARGSDSVWLTATVTKAPRRRFTATVEHEGVAFAATARNRSLAVAVLAHQVNVYGWLRRDLTADEALHWMSD